MVRYRIGWYVMVLYIYRSGSLGGEISDRLLTLKEEIDELDQRERELDQHKAWVQQSIKNVTDEVTNTQYPYLHCHKSKNHHLNVGICTSCTRYWSGSIHFHFSLLRQEYPPILTSGEIMSHPGGWDKPIPEVIHLWHHRTSTPNNLEKSRLVCVLDIFCSF